VPSKQSPALTPAGKAAGTCEGIASATYGSAADGRAPVEDCILADNSGEERFRIAAYYGPYAKAARLETVRGDQFDRAPGPTGPLRHVPPEKPSTRWSRWTTVTVSWTRIPGWSGRL
jgi:hypothetical protein